MLSDGVSEAFPLKMSTRQNQLESLILVIIAQEVKKARRIDLNPRKEKQQQPIHNKRESNPSSAQQMIAELKFQFTFGILLESKKLLGGNSGNSHLS